MVPSKLKQLTVETFSEEGILRDADRRNALIDLLRPEQAKSLAKALGLEGEQPYTEIKSKKIRLFSEAEATLFQFFDLPRPKKPEIPASSVIEANGEYGLFWHQRRAVAETRQVLSTEPRRVLLHMPTGSGKTRTAMRLLCEYLCDNEPGLIVWLAYSEELCEQAIEEFIRAWRSLGNRSLSAQRFWGHHELDLALIEDGFLVAGLSKTYRLAQRSISDISHLATKASVIVIDEAHQAIAETYKLILDALYEGNNHARLIGLTATPGRTYADIDEDAKLAEFFSGNKVTLTTPDSRHPIAYLTGEGYISSISSRTLLSESGQKLSDDDLKRIEKQLDIPQDILEKIGEDEVRNLSIVSEIEMLVSRHTRILVFAATVEHARLLSLVLTARGIVSDFIVSETDSASRTRIIERFKSDASEPMVLCNFGVLTTGFDAPKASAAVIARPTKSLVLYSQMIGRVIRGPRAGGTKNAEIITVLDSWLPGFRDLSEAFDNWEDVWR